MPNQNLKDDILEATIQAFQKKGLKFKWFIIGSGPLKDKLNDQIKKENVEDCVKIYNG